jgi:hypothetical protein
VKLQTPNAKHQRNPKPQAAKVGQRRNLEVRRFKCLRTALVFGVWYFLGVFASSAVDFPLRWRWSNPLPHGGNVVDMAYSPPSQLSLGVQVAERGQIYTTSDLDLWLPRDTFVTNALRAVTFFGQRIVVTGEAGLVLYSDDGEHFQAGTLADGPTADWLEAVAASFTQLVAAGDNGAIYTSTTGATWKKQNSGTNTWFRGAAAGGGNFVVVGENGVILTSPNGTNWIRRTSSTGQDLNRVTFAPAAARFTAVGDAGVTLSSTNGGTNWFFESPGATNSLQYAATSGLELDRLVDGTHEVRIQDGQVWADQLAKTNGPPDWTYFSAIGRPGFFLIAGQSGMQSEGYQISNEPYAWLTPYDSVRNWLWDVVRLPSFYTAVGDLGTVMTSGNGVDWTLELPPPGVTNTTFLGVGGTTNLLVAVGDSGTIIYSPNNTMDIIVTNESGTTTQTVSTLGVIWYRAPAVTANTLQGVGVLGDSLYVVTGARGTILTSTDGVVWLARISPTTNLLSGVAGWPGGLVAVGDNGTVIGSANGFAWTQRTVNTTNWLFRVRWLNGSLVAVGQNGTIGSWSVLAARCSPAATL